MSFEKKGEVPIDKVYCSCGGEIDSKTKQCPKCSKDYKNGTPTKN